MTSCLAAHLAAGTEQVLEVRELLLKVHILPAAHLQNLPLFARARFGQFPGPF